MLRSTCCEVFVDTQEASVTPAIIAIPILRIVVMEYAVHFWLEMTLSGYSMVFSGKLSTEFSTCRAHRFPIVPSTPNNRVLNDRRSLDSLNRRRVSNPPIYFRFIQHSMLTKCRRPQRNSLDHGINRARDRIVATYNTPTGTTGPLQFDPPTRQPDFQLRPDCIADDTRRYRWFCPVYSTQQNQ